MKEFTELEKQIAKNINKKYKWIARDKDKRLWVFADTPKKYHHHGVWSNTYDEYCELPFIDLFQAIQWSDSSPVRIRDIYDPQILDDVEKRYLEEIIRPWKNIVKYVRKTTWISNCYGIEINVEWVNQGGIFSVQLPPYPKEKPMYSGMECDKKYTLDELGLFKESKE